MSTTTKRAVLAGDRPTGLLRLGHFAGSLKARLELRGRVEQYELIADVQALTDNAGDPSKVTTNVLEKVTRRPGTDGRARMSKSLGNTIAGAFVLHLIDGGLSRIVRRKIVATLYASSPSSGACP